MKKNNKDEIRTTATESGSDGKANRSDNHVGAGKLASER